MKHQLLILFVVFLMGLGTNGTAQCIPGHAPGTNVNTANGFLWGQGFIATCDGDLKYVEIISDQTGTVSAGTLNIYNGNSVTGSIYTQAHPAITISNVGDPVRVYVTGTVPLVNSNQYTFEFFVDNVDVLADFNALYSGGTAFQNGSSVPTADFEFNVSIDSVCTNPTISAFSTSSDTICKEDSVTLTVTGILNSALTWQLYTDSCGGTPVTNNPSGVFTLAPSATTTYYIRGEDTTACVNEDSVVCFSVAVAVTIVDTSVTPNGAILTANATGATYQWLYCDSNYAVINGETNQVFMATSNGNYAVEVTENGCVDTSSCYSIVGVGIRSLDIGRRIILVPNPTTGKFDVLSLELEVGEVQVFDMLGNLVLTTPKRTVDLSSYPAGIYFVKVGDSIKKLVLTK